MARHGFALPAQATNPNRRGGHGGKHGRVERWSPGEDALVRRLCPVEKAYQYNWHTITTEFNAASPGEPRSTNSIRNRMLRLRKNEQQVKAGRTGKNKCRVCGRLKKGHVCPGPTVSGEDDE